MYKAITQPDPQHTQKLLVSLAFFTRWLMQALNYAFASMRYANLPRTRLMAERRL